MALHDAYTEAPDEAGWTYLPYGPFASAHDYAGFVRWCEERDDTLTLVASGYTLAFERFAPPGDLGMVDGLDFVSKMREMVEVIRSGRFADEWDAERDADYPKLKALKESHASEGVRALEARIRRRLGAGRER